MSEPAQPDHGCLKWFVRFIFGVVLIVVVLMISGFFYQRWATRRDLQTYPAPGKLVNVGEFDMHIHCQGEGSPTVVFESGLGAYSLAWWTVFDSVAEQTRTCVYDRVSMGWSDYVDTVSSSDDVANNLHALLNNAGESAPYILVGHSAGGIYVRAYANQYPEDVAGIILVDSSHENEANRLPPEIVASGTSPDPLSGICNFVSPSGIRRLSGMADNMVSSFYSDEAIRGAAIARFNRTHHCAALANEVSGYAAAIQQDNPPQSQGDIPLIVLTAGLGWADSPPANIPLEILQEADSVWFDLQEELAALSSNSTHLILEDSDHIIQGDRPDSIIDAVHRMLEMINNR